MENGELEEKVEHIMINKVRLLWGIVVAVVAFGGVFARIFINEALTQQKLDTLIADVQDIKSVVAAQTSSISIDQQNIAVLQSQVSELTNKK